MSKQIKKNSKGVIQKTTKANGTSEYYISTAPQKTLFGKIMIWTLVALMALGSIGTLIVAFINIANK